MYCYLRYCRLNRRMKKRWSTDRIAPEALDWCFGRWINLEHWAQVTVLSGFVSKECVLLWPKWRILLAKKRTSSLYRWKQRIYTLHVLDTSIWMYVEANIIYWRAWQKGSFSFVPGRYVMDTWPRMRKVIKGRTHSLHWQIDINNQCAIFVSSIILAHLNFRIASLSVLLKNPTYSVFFW